MDSRHPRAEVRIDEGLVRLVGIIAWGDMSAGDPATHPACAWMLFGSPPVRSDFMAAYRPWDAVTSRARAWAVFFVSALADSGDARHVGMGGEILENLIGGGSAWW